MKWSGPRGLAVSGGRLVVQPTVGWHRAEYEALGVPFRRRGNLLDEHLEVWKLAWRPGPASFHGHHYRFDEVHVEPKPHRPGGPPLWFGGSRLHDRLLDRLVAYGSGFNPLGPPGPGELERLRRALRAAERDPGEVELVGGVRGTFPDPSGRADLGRALEAIPPQLERGFTTFCVKPSQFTDDLADVGRFCREVVDRVAALAG